LRRFFSGIFSISWLHNAFDALRLAFRHASAIWSGVGNGFVPFPYLLRYVLSISAVWFFRWYVPLRCCFTPFMRIMACSASMSSIVVSCSSFGSAPISARIVKVMVYFSVAWFIIAFTLSGVGIIGVLGSTL